jgi:3-deoxy-manno-octulosonate cytidylyltransferase (CMP-KDO synthetase)
VVIFVVHPGARTTAARTSLRSIAIIPARYGSTRLPGKPLLEIAGRPLIEHVYRRACRAPSLEAVIVATDDARIKAVVEGFGGVARLTAPEHPTGSDRLAEVAEHLDCDLIVNVQGDEPLVEPAMIEQLLAPFADEPALQMTTLRRRIDDPAELMDPNVVKVVTDGHDHALYFSRAPIPGSPDGLTPHGEPLGYKHIGVYAYRRAFLRRFTTWAPTPLERRERLEQLRVLEHGHRIKALETLFDPIGVDTPGDLARVRQLALETPVAARAGEDP